MIRPVKVRRHVRRRITDRIERIELSKKAIQAVKFGIGKETVILSQPRTKVMLTGIGGGGAETQLIAPEAEVQVSRSAWQESMAHTLDQLFEFNIVPPTYLRETDGKGVAVQQWIHGAAQLPHPLEEAKVNEKDLIKIFLFDVIVGQTDRHRGNIVAENNPPYHAWAIDNENIMESEYGMFRLNCMTIHAAFKYIEGKQIPQSVLQRIRGVRWEDFVTATAGVSPSAQRAAWARRATVLKWKTIPTIKQLET